MADAPPPFVDVKNVEARDMLAHDAVFSVIDEGMADGREREARWSQFSRNHG